jgi:hypothetical protein
MKDNLNTDTANDRGLRIVQPDEVGNLVNFAFNQKAKLASVLRAPYSVTVAAGTATVTFAQGINPKWDIKAPTNSTRFQLGLIVAGKVQGEDRFERAITMRPIDNLDTVIAPGAPVLTATLPAGTYDYVVVAMGIFFGQEVNGEDYAFYNKAFNALDIIHADLP